MTLSSALTGLNGLTCLGMVLLLIVGLTASALVASRRASQPQENLDETR